MYVYEHFMRVFLPYVTKLSCKCFLMISGTELSGEMGDILAISP